MATEAGLQMLESQFGQRVLNDVHGISIYECEPDPLFARGKVDFVLGKGLDPVLMAIELAVETASRCPRAGG